MRNNEIGFEIKALNNLIKRRVEMSETKEEVEHLTGVHGFVIGYISDHDDEDIFQRDIEEKFEIRRSTATGIINLMEKNGLIIREKVDYDARLKKLVLTDKAREINKLVEEDISRIERTIAGGIDGADLDLTSAILNSYHYINEFYNERSFVKYVKMFESYLKILATLGYDWSDAFDAYFLKLEENHHRQETNY